MFTHGVDASRGNVAIFFVAVDQFRLDVTDIPHVGRWKVSLHLMPLSCQNVSGDWPHPGGVALPFEADTVVPDWCEKTVSRQLKQKGSQEA